MADIGKLLAKLWGELNSGPADPDAVISTIKAEAGDDSKAVQAVTENGDCYKAEVKSKPAYDAAQTCFEKGFAKFVTATTDETTPNPDLNSIDKKTSISLPEAQADYARFVISQARDVKNTDDFESSYNHDQRQSRQQLILSKLTNKDDQDQFQAYLGEIEKAAISMRKQVDSDDNAAYIMLSQSVLVGGLRIPNLLPIFTFEGNFSPLTATYSLTRPYLTAEQHLIRRAVLGGAQLVSAMPPYDLNIQKLFEDGNETGSTGATLSLSMDIAKKISAADIENEIWKSRIVQSGQKVAPYLFYPQLALDSFSLFANGMRFSEGYETQASLEKGCQKPSLNDANQWRNSSIITDWKESHPGEQVPVEVLKQAKEDYEENHPQTCDETLNFANAGDRASLPLYGTSYAKNAFAMGADSIAEFGPWGGLIPAALAGFVIPGSVYGIRLNNPTFTWQINPTEDKGSLTPPHFSESDRRAALKGAALITGTHGVLGTGLSYLAFDWDKPGSPYDPFAAASLTSVYEGLWRAFPRTELNATMLRDNEGSTFSVMPVVISNLFGGLEALSDGAMDASLFDRQLEMSKVDIAQISTVFAARAAIFAMEAVKTHQSAQKFGHEGALWAIYGSRLGSYGLGMALYMTNTLGLGNGRNEIRSKNGIHLGGPDGSLLSITAPLPGTSKFNIGLTPVVMNDAYGQEAPGFNLSFDVFK